MSRPTGSGDTGMAVAADLAVACAVLVLLGLTGHVVLAIPGAAVVVALAVFTPVAAAVALHAPASPPSHGIGAANRITLLRGVLTALAAGLVPWPGVVAEHGWPVMAITGTAIALDGADGWLARRWQQETRFGARFDMEVDALLILVLSILAWLLGKAGPWVLLIGLMRYLFVAAGLVLPALRGPLDPGNFRRKAICVVQVASLLVFLAPPVGPAVATPAAAVALALLTGSFGLDVHHLLRHPPYHRPSDGRA